MSRRENVLKRINLATARGLELGPLHSPVVSKDEAKVSYVDHLSTEGLKKKYANDPVPPDQIAPIDYVLKNNSLKETVNGKRFDYVIAAHVIEHIPDTVRWLQGVAAVLKDGGILSLVIPDKRFTFDIMRNVSRPADVLGAYLEEHTRASLATMYDFTVEARDKIDPHEVWAAPLADYSKKPTNSLEKTMDACKRNLVPGEYVDSHCFVYTPYSFVSILRSLIQHDLLDYEVVYFCDTQENQLEFYVSLQKSKASRLKKLRSLPKLPKPREMRELEAENQALREQVHSLVTSRSWRVTKPLRSATELLKDALGKNG